MNKAYIKYLRFIYNAVDDSAMNNLCFVTDDMHVSVGDGGCGGDSGGVEVLVEWD